MKTLYLECNMGAAGDMLMAALTELMPDKDAFVKELNDLQIPQVNIERTTIAKCGIMGTHMVVTVNGEEEKSIDVPMHAHTHSHVHEEHEHTHEHHHEHSDEEHFHAHHHEHSDEEYSHHHHEHGDDACSHNHTHEHHEEHHTHSHVYEEHEHTHEHSHEGHPHAHSLHAESAALLKIKDLDLKWNKVEIYISRPLKCRPYGLAKPCKACEKLIKDMGIKKIHYTSDENSFITEEWMDE